METTDLKACANCVHHVEVGSGTFVFHICGNPKYHREDPNYVTGEMFFIRPYCHDARRSSKLCGPDGAGWEEGPAKEPKSDLSTWAHLKLMLKEFFL